MKASPQPERPVTGTPESPHPRPAADASSAHAEAPPLPRTSRRSGELLAPTLFLVSDLLALQAAFQLTFFVRFLTGWMATPLGVPPYGQYLVTSVALCVIWAWIFYQNGLYDPRRTKSLGDDFERLVKGVIIGSMVVLSLAFFVRSASYSRTFFGIFFWLSLFFLTVGRGIARAWLSRHLRRGGAALRVLFLGATAMRGRLLETFESQPGLGLHPVGQVLDPEAEDTSDGSRDDTGRQLPVLGDAADIERIVDAHEVDLVLLTVPFRKLWKVTEIAERIGDRNVEVQFVPDMERLHASRMRLREIAGIPFISVRETGLSGIDRIVKRAFDVVGSATLLLVSAPLMLVLAVLVRASSPGPIFYGQERLGRDHRPFRMLKFRTMRVDAEAESGPVWTVEDDPRRTRIGTFLRRYSLDELPQFLNVLRGDMSLVGPRPEREVFVDDFQQRIPRYLERHRVRSGLTGWAQVHGLRGNTPVEVRTLYDLYYVENWSLALDVRILLKTVEHVLRGENAY